MPLELSASGTAPQSVDVGGELLLRLDENATTGYRWELNLVGDGALEVVDDRSVAAGADLTPGAGRQRVIRFVARKAGTVQVQATLRRSWQGPEGTLEQRVCTVVVR
jgi:predicted secreted protein